MCELDDSGDEHFVPSLICGHSLAGAGCGAIDHVDVLVTTHDFAKRPGVGIAAASGVGVHAIERLDNYGAHDALCARCTLEIACRAFAPACSNSSSNKAQLRSLA